MLIRAAQAKGLHCEFLPEKVIEISNGSITHYFKGTNLPCNDAAASRISCNKYFLRRLLKKYNLPIPRTISLRHPAAWRTVLTSSLRFPLVVKPINASHANGASLNITTPAELQRAVARAFAYIRKNQRVDRVLVEEFFAGQDLRLLVIGNQVVSVLKRDPAYVIGNGHSTIRALIHTFNQEWRSPIKYDLPLCPIPIDNEVSRYLTKHKLTLNSILPKGKKTYLRWNANVSTGGRPSDITDQVHPHLIQLAIQVAKLSHLAVGGVDMLCKDFTISDISSHNISLLEINDSPGLDIHHFPISGAGRDVSAAIIDHIFDPPATSPILDSDHIEALISDLQIDTHDLTPALPTTTKHLTLRNH